MAPVKSQEDAPNVGGMQDRIDRVLDVLSMWASKPLTYAELAELTGGRVTENAIKKWRKRGRIPTDAANALVATAERHQVEGLTLDWLLRGHGPGPQKRAGAAPSRPQDDRSAVPEGEGPDGVEEKVSQALSLSLELTGLLNEIRETVARDPVQRADRFLPEEASARAAAHPERRVARQRGGPPSATPADRRKSAGGPGD